jgi:hypothetical protein
MKSREALLHKELNLKNHRLKGLFGKNRAGQVDHKREAPGKLLSPIQKHNRENGSRWLTITPGDALLGVLRT